MKDGWWGMAEKTATRSIRGNMDLKALKELVRQGENERLEFKLKATHPEKIIREVVAFANTVGGTLLVGVGDDKSIPGLKFADDDEFILCRALEKHCFPEIEYTLERVPVAEDREVLVFRIPKSDRRPHHVSLEPEGEKKTYVRVNDRSIQASKEVRQILKWENRARDVKFNYGRKEQVLMKYLDENPGITVEDFSRIAHIPLWMASKTLITLTLANVLSVKPDETADRFVMAAA
ncbi:AlbA family DNA-binding domain-containing protein [Siphonobacter aquaeclarae]|jgi:predicted HTH transcriptional regulator|uniref:Putative DNA-binding domain-containing protein n=1 Tax=Siphonobacter aquaeclarae TaxID=563176 RepID=A0A1G9MZ50_9BACT|nr:ATP-binding protein [Siphonobacter aquaeclarae]SDL79552.1 Putative DNA-binding domain-containing protein [Siphonobacter aquaeclarae]